MNNAQIYCNIQRLRSIYVDFNAPCFMMSTKDLATLFEVINLWIKFEGHGHGHGEISSRVQ